MKGQIKVVFKDKSTILQSIEYDNYEKLKDAVETALESELGISFDTVEGAIMLTQEALSDCFILVNKIE